MYTIRTYKKVTLKNVILSAFTEISGEKDNIQFYVESTGHNKWLLVYNVYNYSIDDLSSIEKTVTTKELFEFLKYFK